MPTPDLVNEAPVPEIAPLTVEAPEFEIVTKPVEDKVPSIEICVPVSETGPTTVSDAPLAIDMLMFELKA